MAVDSAAVLATKRRRLTFLERIRFLLVANLRLAVRYLALTRSLSADAMHKGEPKQCILGWTHGPGRGLTGPGCAGILRTQKLCEIDARRSCCKPLADPEPLAVGGRAFTNW